LPAEKAPPLVRFSTTAPADATARAHAADLQRWLNRFPGIFLRVDGIAGPDTSAAFRRVTGRYLPGDSRSAGLGRGVPAGQANS